MVSATIEELHDAVRRVGQRRKVILHVKQIGLSLGILAAVFILCGVLEMAWQPPASVRILFFGLWVAVIGVLGLWYARAVRRFDSDDRRLAQFVDDHTPELEQRLITSMDSWEKQGTDFPSQLVESLWLDTVIHMRGRNIRKVTDSRPAWYAAGAAVGLICLLSGALWESSRFSAAARRLAWPWSIPAVELRISADFKVSPGDILIRRGSDVAVTATFEGASSENVFLYLREKASEWSRIPMRADDSTTEYLYYLPGVADDITYYVDSGRGRSRQYRIQVFDLPRIESIDVDYIYPAHTGMENKTEKNGGDIIAPQGTGVRLHITFNRPIQRSMLKFDNGATIDLSPSKKAATGEFTVARDGTYLVDAFDDEGRNIENPMEYMIRSIADAPPEISVTMPGRDLRVMALEEISIAAAGKDDYGITKLALNYSVAGGTEQHVDLLSTARQDLPPTIHGKAIIYLEDLKVTPGDLITYYFTAADNNDIGGPSQVISDIYFLEVINTDEEFRRASQQGGGGGGQSGQGRPPSALVENQKNIIAATWKLLNRQKQGPGETFSEDVKVVAESQANLTQRTQMSLSRLTERFSFADESYDRSVTHLQEAVKQMQAAAEKLSAENLREALGPEQAALQAVLKAESQSRRTALQMARNRGGGSAGSGSMREREDLRELFDMEMGRLENRYEMPGTASGPGGAEQGDVLKRLRQLAQRQERLNRAQLDAARRKDRLSEAQQRRQLEELRREQESLSRQAEALARKWSRQSGLNQTQSALSSLDQAIKQMREAARNLERRAPGTAAASGSRALQRLRDQEKRIQRRQATTVADLVKELGEKARQLKAQEHEILSTMEALSSAENQERVRPDQKPSPGTRDGLPQIIAKKDQLQDTLKETEDIIRATGAKGRQSQPEVTRKALEALRSLKSESIGQQIEKSKVGLQAGRLGLAMEMEKEIEQSIRRFSSRLQEFDPLIPKSEPERIQQAADNAAALSRELENLQRQVEALKMKQREAALTRGATDLQPGGSGRDQPSDLNRMRDGLVRSRRYAQGLLQPWAQGERWAVDARSIYRELTRAQIEDFMNQPDLWQSLLEPVQELASKLRARTEVTRFNDNTFSPSEQAPPPRYESQVETYYKTLSELTDKRK